MIIDSKKERAKQLAGVDYDLHPMCVDCILNHVEKEGKKWKVMCNPIPAHEEDETYLMDNMSEEEFAVYKIATDYDIFASSQFDLKLRDFQKELLMCTSRRKVLRLPRRAGKTVVMALLALNYIFKNPGGKVLVATPYLSQINVIFDAMNDFIKKSDMFMSMIIKTTNSKSKLYTSNPHTFEFTNGSIIKGFTTGAQEASNIRGQSAGMIILDEVDYMGDGDIEAIIPILMTTPDTIFVAASTPSGRKSYFYEWCRSDAYKHVHRVYQQLENYDPQQDEELRAQNPLEKYEREVLAEFTLQESGVYRPDFVVRALKEYELDDLNNLPEAIYTFGIDWNEAAGVHIVVVRSDHSTNKLVTSNVIVVPPSKLTQIHAVEKIIELDQLYKPKLILADAGFGNTQMQMLMSYASSHPEQKLEERLESIAFQSYIKLSDPTTGGFTEQPIKPFMVNISVRYLEENKIILPTSEDYPSKLVGQMRSYVVEGFGANGMPKYVKGNVHTLEAWQLAILGIWKLSGDVTGGQKFFFYSPKESEESAKNSQSYYRIGFNRSKGFFKGNFGSRRRWN